MTCAYFIAMVLACNPESPTVSQGPTEKPPPAHQAPEFDQRSKIKSIVEIPRPRIRARHILVAHQGASSAPDDIERTLEEAKALAESLVFRLQNGEAFDTIAKQHSDDGTGKRGGDLGVFTKGVMNKVFEAATLALQPGQRSPVVQTPFGFHIIERLEVIEVNLAHVLIQWAGLKKTRSERSREDANARAQQALALLDAGRDFSLVAVDWSDGPFGPRGGALGWFQKGQMVPQFDDTAFALKPGEYSTIVESPHGFHIIMRID
jgi:peptidyl-prolyl cis-trans isomerase SurA